MSKRDPTVFILVRTTEPEAYTLLTDRQGFLTGFHTLADGLHYYEGAYNRKHAQSFEGSMSACFNAMTFQPSVFAVTSLDDLKDLPVRDEDGAMKLVSMRNVSGGIWGIPCHVEKAKAVWEKGEKPRLIS